MKTHDYVEICTKVIIITNIGIFGVTLFVSLIGIGYLFLYGVTGGAQTCP